MRLRVTGAPPLGESVGKIAADKNLAVRLDDDDAEPSLFAFGSKPSSADCPRTAVATNSNSTTIAVIFINP